MNRTLPSVLLLLAVTWLTACARTPPETAIRAHIAEMEKAVERRSASGVLAHLADSFSAESSETGRLDRDAAKRTLAGVLLAHPNIKIGATVRALEIQGDTAQSVVEVLAAGGPGLLPDAAWHFTFQLSWLREGSDWKLVRARWGDSS